jgi:cytochrome c553
MMKKLFLSSLLVSSSLFAADGASLYKSCVACHGANGEVAAMNGKSKIIKDMSKADFVASMKGYKDGSYGGALKGLMKGQVVKLSDADIQTIADYIVK